LFHNSALETASAHLSLRDIPSPGNTTAQLGDYELLEAVAQGGMGVVYKARQRSLNRIVALKLLLGGVHARPDFKRRFRQEAETAARLHHSNIVPIYEVGEHEGQPYFSMEFIPGLNLAGLPQPLSPAKAAEYLECVARTMSYAHGQGVLHRDLKPSNILLGADDRPRVTDFGLAGQMDLDSTLTLSGEMLGTPGYLPPEQASVKKREIGPASDIYAIGAVLYFALTGRPPFVAGTLAETLRQVLVAEPISLRRLNPAIPRDLETICLKCLEKEPLRRYASALALAEDLRRFQEGRPILTKPAGPLNRLAKWCRREPVVAGLVITTLATLTLGLSVSTWLLFRERAARLTAATEKLRADEHAAIAQAVNEFVANDLIRQASSTAQADAGLTPNPNLTLREAVDRAADGIGNRFKDRPLIEAGIRSAIGDAYAGLGEPERALAHLERALALVRDARGDSDRETFAAMNSLAQAYQDAGKPAVALPLIEASLQGTKAMFGTQHTNTLDLMNNVASIYREVGKTNEAVQWFEQTVQLRQAIQGHNHPDTLTTMGNLAGAYRTAGRLEDAIKLFEETLELQKLHLGLDNPTTHATMSNLGYAYRLANKPELAVPLMEETLRMQKASLGNRHFRTQRTMDGLAMVRWEAGQRDAAMELFRELLVLRATTLGTNQLQTLETTSQLAATLVAQKRFSEAEPLLLKICTVLTSPGAATGDSAAALLQRAGNRLVKLYESTGKTEEAAVWQRRLASPTETKE
jgi:tetratricopeptide (TPR) repeat protein/tRNA A-37 threonylcarbamoyl transferase component Bud32